MKIKNLLFDTPGWTITPNNPNGTHHQTESMPVIATSKAQRKRKRQKTQSALVNVGVPELEVKTHQDQSSSIRPSSPKLKGKSKKAHQTTTVRNSKSSTGASSSHLAYSLLNSSLSGSRFRILNETLYTCTGPEAAELFNDQEDDDGLGDPSQNFSIYHHGFRQQTKSWPQNPVNLIASQLQAEYKNLNQSRTILVADLGCGEAPLAKLLCGGGEKDLSIESQKKKGSNGDFRVFSFDLVSDPDGWVTIAECSNQVPLPGSQSDTLQNGMMDAVVCCLSLMGTNWVGMILEARRILRSDGQLKIAEVSSRFTDVEQFVEFIISIGFSEPTKDQSNSHFILFTFKKTRRTSPSQLQMNQLDRNPEQKNELIDKGTKLLKPCIYKRR